MHHQGTCKTHSGFVLVIVLLIMQILTLASWNTLVNAYMSLKISRQLPLSHAMFIHAEMAMDQTEHRVMRGLGYCHVPVMPVVQLIRQYLLPREISSTCSGVVGEGIYHYRTESLGTDPCLSLQGSGQSAEFVRLTQAWREPPWYVPVILQAIILKPVVLNEVCRGQNRRVRAGRVAWREVDI